MAVSEPVLLPAGTLIFGSPDIDLWRNSTRPRPIWMFDMNVAGSDMLLRISWRGGLVEVSTDASSPDPETYGRLELLRRSKIEPGFEDPAPTDTLYRDAVRWDFTDAAVRALPLGRIARGRLYRDARRKGAGELRLYRDFFFIVRG